MYNKLMNMFWRKADGVVWDLMTGSMGVIQNKGKKDEVIVSLQGSGDSAELSANIFTEMSVALPAFATNVPVHSVAIGDLIYQNNKPKGWVTGIQEANEEKEIPRKFTLMSVSGTTSTWTPPKINILGSGSGVMVLKSLVSLVPDGQNGLESLQGNLMPLLMMGGDGLDLEKFMPMMLMGQLGLNGDGNSGVFGNNMIQSMMMMKMLNSGSSDSRTNFFDI